MVSACLVQSKAEMDGSMCSVATLEVDFVSCDEVALTLNLTVLIVVVGKQISSAPKVHGTSTCRGRPSVFNSIIRACKKSLSHRTLCKQARDFSFTFFLERRLSTLA
jgi:hypothetical protein